MARPFNDPESLATAIERIAFLEWRLEQAEDQLAAEREATARQRRLVAEAARREAEGAERLAALERRLAEARAEAARLGDRAARADDTRREIERRGTTAEKVAADYAKLLAAKRKDDAEIEALEAANGRIERLEGQLSRFFDRLVRWQHAVADGDRDAVDLAELIAELRNEVLRLGAESDAKSEANQKMREALADAGVAPPEPPAPPPPASTPAWLRPAAEEGSDSSGSVDAEEARRLLSARSALDFDALLIAAPERAAACVDKLLAAAGADAAPALAVAFDCAASFEARAACLAGLAEAGGPLALPALARAASDEDWRLRAAAIEARLGTKTLDADVGDALTEALEDPDARVRRRAVIAAAGALGFDPTNTLLARIGDPDPATRRAIATAVGERGDERALLALTHLLLDPDATVRRGVARVLSRRVDFDLAMATSDAGRRQQAAAIRERLTRSAT